MVHQVDALGQQPGLDLYTQITLCYPVTDASSYVTIVSTLNDGLERLAAKVPWAAGEVVVEGASEGNSGMAIIKPMEELPRVVVKDLRNDPSALSMQTLRDAEFPMSLLDENMLCPRNTLPGTPDEPTSRPTFLVQATFVSGGLLLSFVGQHQVMDMIGQAVLMDLLNKACHHEEFTAKELSIVNVARENVIPLLDESEKTGFEHQVVPPVPSSNETSEPVATPPPQPPSTWAYFSFDAAALASLKSIATETVPSGFISTDDALSALIWQSIIRARLPRLSPTDKATFARAVDVRGILGLEAKYPGVVQNMAYNPLKLQQIVDEPLGVIASRLRAALDKDALGCQARALATHLSRAQDKKSVYVLAPLNLSADMMLSSWAKVECWNLDFNIGLGKPEAVRRPKFSPFPSLMYLMPKASNGEVSAAICLMDEDMDRLKADKEFIKFGRFIG
ncbi:hypothetical protein BGZ59_004574 [Podila verticillata]|nr:hypothetical protein BGZ59_004574 [Podila verticillata]